MQFTVDYRVENYILNTKWEDLPKEIQERAVVCGIDLMTALILGSHGRQFAAGEKLAQSVCRDGEIPVVGSRNTYNLMGATIAMSHASNSFDIDDGHNMIKGHPGTSFVAGILAAALEQGVSYREYLTTLVVAYEVTIRFALAEQNHYQYLHSTGCYGAFGTAAGMGRLFGIDKEKLNTALSIADFHAPIVPVMRSVTTPSMNKDGVPFGALVGAMAMLEAISGSSGRGHLLEAEEYRLLAQTLGTSYEIMNLYFKPYTCCRWAHQPIAAGLSLMQKYSFGPDQIKETAVYTFDAAAQLSQQIPTETDEAQYNIAYPVAAALVHGDLGFLQVREEALENPKVLNMMKRLKFIVDPVLEAQFPQKRLARLEVTLQDGTLLRSETFSASGEASDHVDLVWIAEKFRRITAPVLETKKQEELLSLLSGDLDVPVRQIVDFINR